MLSTRGTARRPCHAGNPCRFCNGREPCHERNRNNSGNFASDDHGNTRCTEHNCTWAFHARNRCTSCNAASMCRAGKHCKRSKSAPDIHDDTSVAHEATCASRPFRNPLRWPLRSPERTRNPHQCFLRRSIRCQAQLLEQPVKYKFRNRWSAAFFFCVRLLLHWNARCCRTLLFSNVLWHLQLAHIPQRPDMILWGSASIWHHCT